jgi:hypothetical protein
MKEIFANTAGRITPATAYISQKIFFLPFSCDQENPSQHYP